MGRPEARKLRSIIRGKKDRRAGGLAFNYKKKGAFLQGGRKTENQPRQG